MNPQRAPTGGRDRSSTLLNMLERLKSPGASRALVWISTLVLVAGVIAFVTVRLGSNDSSASPSPTPISEEEADQAIDGPETTPPAIEDVPRGARVAAGQFILAAAGREDLPKAWKLSHPDLRAQCACTYKQWLTGNIPVQPFPTAGLQGVSYFVDELAPGRVVLQVLLNRRPAASSATRRSTSASRSAERQGQESWLVDIWSPISGIPVPQAGG